MKKSSSLNALTDSHSDNIQNSSPDDDPLMMVRRKERVVALRKSPEDDEPMEDYYGEEESSMIIAQEFGYLNDEEEMDDDDEQVKSSSTVGPTVAKAKRRAQDDGVPINERKPASERRQNVDLYATIPRRSTRNNKTSKVVK